MDLPDAVAEQKKRADQVWQNRSGWNELYREAYDYAIPQRRPGRKAPGKSHLDRIFDMTATMSSMYFAGSLQRDLFPAGQPPFTLEAGPIAKMALDQPSLQVLNKALDGQAQRAHPFFLAGDWDTAVHEMCIDLGVGTGALIPLKGDRNNPIVFAAVPFDEIAVKCDALGRQTFITWKQCLEQQAIVDGFPRGTFDDDFAKAAKDNPYAEVDLYQDFFKLPSGRWQYVAYTAKSQGYIVRETTRTQPIAVPRYYRVPGEAYGRGPILLALPSIKTLNKAQELTLRAAAIQMLGIWGYRAGGTFNPNTVALAPGAMWPMQSTGGVLGPDVSRLDVAAGNLNVAGLIVGNLQADIKAALFDQRLPEDRGTPVSASEIAARLRQKADVHIGAFGRLVREVMPVVVPRVYEILYDFGYVQSPIPIDVFLVSIAVQSPMAAAQDADRLAGIANYIQFVGALVGQDKLRAYADIDAVLERVRAGFQVSPSLVPSPDQRDATLKQIAQAQTAQAVAAIAAKTAPAAPAPAPNEVGQLAEAA